MIKPNFMEKLLEGVEVEWKSLGELGEFVYGYAAKAQDSGDARFIRITDINMNGRLIPTDAKFVDISEENEKFILKKNDLLMARTGATYGKTMIFEEDYPAIFAGFLIKLSFDKKIINPKYYWHFSQSELFWHQANKLVSGGGQPQFNANAVREVKIPIPPIKVQEEIVRILDAFTELTAELTAELTSRKKQYTYYRDKLLTFEEGEVEWKTLGDVFDFKNGINKGKEFFGSGDYIINYTDVFKKSKLFENSICGKVQTSSSDIERFNCKKGDVFFTRTSETKDEIGYASVLLSDIPNCVFSGFLLRARPRTNLLLPEYCAYCFNSSLIRKEIISSSNMTTRVTTTGSILSKIKIPIPPIEEQARIVSILDKFDALTNSITEGLPREIELRQKQYEYYRNMLFSFPRSEVEA